MNTSKAVAIFASIYFVQWIIMGAMIHFVSDFTFTESLTQVSVGAFMILFGWIIPCIVALDYYEWANKKTVQRQIDKEWERTNNQWSNI